MNDTDTKNTLAQLTNFSQIFALAIAAINANYIAVCTDKDGQISDLTTKLQEANDLITSLGGNPMS